MVSIPEKNRSAYYQNSVLMPHVLRRKKGNPGKISNSFGNFVNTVSSYQAFNHLAAIINEIMGTPPEEVCKRFPINHFNDPYV